MKYVLVIIESLLCFVIMNSCDINKFNDPENGFGNINNEIELSISVQLLNNVRSSDSEKSVHLLRLMAFNQGGNLIINKSFNDASDALSQVNGLYRILERIPRNSGVVKVCLIANEPSRWRLNRPDNDPDGPVTYTRLKNKTIDYEQDYPVVSGSGPSLDIDINRQGVVMFAEKEIFVGNDGESKNVSLDLCRMIAKVTLSLSYNIQNIAGVDFASGDTFMLHYATIGHQPAHSYLTQREYDSDVYPLLSSAHRVLQADVMPDGEIHSVPVVFYIPEHILSEACFINKYFTYLNVVGEYIPALGPSVITRYQIPIGDGLQKKYTDPAYITIKSDYAISRNHHYFIDGKIRTLGEKDGFHVNLQIKPWNEDAYFDIETQSPFLHVSDIFLNKGILSVSSEYADQISYWSNQPQDDIRIDQIITKCYDAFGNYTGDLADNQTPGTELMITKVPSALPGSGYIDLKLKVGNVFWNSLEVSFYIKAGGLNRRITVLYSMGNIVS